MKRLFLLTLIALSLIAPSALAQPEIWGYLSHKNVNDTSNATVALLSGSSGNKIRLVTILLSVATQDTVTLKCGSGGTATTEIGPIYFGANSGLTQQLNFENFQCADNTTLNLVKGTAGTDVTAYFTYRQE